MSEEEIKADYQTFLGGTGAEMNQYGLPAGKPNYLKQFDHLLRVIQMGGEKPFIKRLSSNATPLLRGIVDSYISGEMTGQEAASTLTEIKGRAETIL